MTASGAIVARFESVRHAVDWHQAGLVARYGILTAAVFLPLAICLATQSRFYPTGCWSMFSEAGKLDDPTLYMVLSGSRADGKWFPLCPNTITDGLGCRTFMLLAYVNANDSLKISYPHPKNQQFLNEVGGVEHLPDAAYIPILLKAWGDAYNELVAQSPEQRLVKIKIDEREWPGGKYENYDVQRRSWEVSL